MNRIKESITKKTLISVVVLLVIFSVIAGTAGYSGFTKALLNQYTEDAFRTAETATLLIQGDDIYRYSKSGGKTSEYRHTLSLLSRLCNASGATFIYLIQPDRSDYGHITFIFSAMNSKVDYTLYDFGYVRETTNDDYRTKYRQLYETSSDEALVIRNKGFIETDPHITVMKAVKGSDNKVKGILCVQRQMDVLITARNYYVNMLIALFAFAAVLSGGLFTVFMNNTMIEPIRSMTAEALRFAENGDLPEEKLSATITTPDEIGVLAQSIDSMEEQLNDNVHELTRITAERERINTELSLAAAIQKNMLPSVFPPFPDRTEFDIYASMDPAREVGGDFYNFFFVDDDHLCILIADVSGKGIPAALFMMASMIELHNAALTGRSPAEIFEYVNTLICSNNKLDMFVTVWLGILDVNTGVMQASNAGHEYPFICKPNGEFEMIKDKHGLVIGAMDTVKYTDYEIKLEPGSKIFVYTDGVPEATDINNTLFGTDRTLEALDLAADRGPEEVLQSVNTAVADFVGEAEQFDDLTMLCLEFKGRKC